MIDWWSWRWRGLFLAVAVVVGIIAGWAISNTASPRTVTTTQTVTVTSTVTTTQPNVAFLQAVWYPDKCEMSISAAPPGLIDYLIPYEGITPNSTGGYYALLYFRDVNGSVVELPVLIRFMSPNITLPFVCNNGVPVAVRYGTYVNGPYFEQIVPKTNEVLDWPAARCTGNCTIPLPKPISVKQVVIFIVYASPALANMTMRSSPDLLLLNARLHALFTVTFIVVNATS
ncbi:hypothetical protein TUZN_2019 [Thermoproteus uzoniensis 768-20]|uniref:Uncharacterized protein n=1 Tax=Thermoproteus uzoniensis (strain 768-20) TaxID=999630 RepID=F2L4X3_THEU7|nr:hypothetical protein [Thermoproteus uzoniensis]AEA13477.1 hypothetical protein TUZN_2019 [Thermoproteus uzoniensis 768-20]